MDATTASNSRLRCAQRSLSWHSWSNGIITFETGCDETDPLKPGPITVSLPNASVTTVMSKGNPPFDKGVLELVKTLKISVTEKSNNT
jgi:hypothetical protein